MAEKKINLRIITPNEVALDEPADMVIMRCTTGDMGIMHGHEPRCMVLDYGIMRIFDGDADERWLAVYGGLAQIKDNTLTVMTGEAEWPHEVDADRSRGEQELIKERLQDHVDEVEILRDEALLRRALVQVELSAYPYLAKIVE